MNSCTSQIIQQVFLTRIQPKQNNALDNFEPYNDEKSTPKAQDIEMDHRDLVGKSLTLEAV